MGTKTYSISSTGEHRSGRLFGNVFLLCSETASSFLVQSRHERRLMMLELHLLLYKLYGNMSQSQQRLLPSTSCTLELQSGEPFGQVSYL